MTVAQLGLAIDSSQAARAAVDLDKLTTSSETVEKAVNKLGSTAPANLNKVAAGTGPISQKLREAAKDADNFGNRIERALNVRSIGSNITKDLIGGLTSVINPANLATAAIATLATAAVGYFYSLGEDIPESEASLKRHAEAIKSIKAAYGEAAEGLDNYFKQSKAVADAIAANEAKDLTRELITGATELQKYVGSFSASSLGAGTVTFNTLQKAVRDLDASVADGEPNVRRFLDVLARIETSNNASESQKQFARDIRESGSTAAETERKLRSLEGGMNALGSSAYTNSEKVGQLTSAMRTLASIGLPDLDDQGKALKAYQDAVGASGGLEDRVAAAKQYEDALARIAQRQVEANIPIPANKPNLESFALPKDVGAEKIAREVDRAANAYRDLLKSAQDRVDQSKMEADTAGLSGIAQDTLRFKLDLLQKAQDKGRTITETQTKALMDQVAAYEANATAAAKATLAADLRFEREQLGRSPTDQTIASTLKGAGLPIDFNSESAAAIRFNEQLKQAQDLASGFASTFTQSMESGKDFMESLGDAATSVLTKISDQLIDMAARQLVANAFGGGASGSGGGGGLFGSILGSIGLGGSGGLSSSFFPAAPSMGGVGLWETGGYTGEGPASKVAGLVHAGEYVFSKTAVDRIGAGKLDAIHSNLKGYASGGLVGSQADPGIMIGTSAGFGEMLA